MASLECAIRLEIQKKLEDSILLDTGTQKHEQAHYRPELEPQLQVEKGTQKRLQKRGGEGRGMANTVLSALSHVLSSPRGSVYVTLKTHS